MKNLRVAVVGMGYGIDQSSSLEEILACEGTKLYPITDYFQDQNDEALDACHWSFLIDFTTNEDITGTNIPGVHQADNSIDEKLLIERLILEMDCMVDHIKGRGDSVDDDVTTLLSEIKQSGKYRIFPPYNRQTEQDKIDVQELTNMKFFKIK